MLAASSSSRPWRKALMYLHIIYSIVGDICMRRWVGQIYVSAVPGKGASCVLAVYRHLYTTGRPTQVCVHMFRYGKKTIRTARCSRCARGRPP